MAHNPETNTSIKRTSIYRLLSAGDNSTMLIAPSKEICELGTIYNKPDLHRKEVCFALKRMTMI